jgi:hypothetical protein
VSTVRGIINEINKKQLVCAVEYDIHTLMECIAEAECGGPFTGSFDFDVMVCTVSRAVMEENASVIERAMMVGIIGCEILDEVHVVITNCEWMTHVNLIRSMRRHGVPSLAMTGTLQKGLEFELAQALMCNVGMINPNGLEVTRAINIYNGINLEPRDRNDQMIIFRKNRGFYRSPCTLPNHIAIAFQEAHGNEKDMCQNAVEAMFRASEKNSFFVAESVLIICATRDQADICHRFASTHIKNKRGVCLLKGRESTAEVEKFHAEFTQGTTYGGIVTSVGAQSLDKKNLNMVIILSLCYSSDLLAQAVARAGRDMQSSLVLYVHHERLTQIIRRNYTEAPYKHLEAYMGGLDATIIERCLSPHSLSNFIDCGENECHWEKLRETIDNDSDHHQHKNHNWCCGNCVVGIKRYANAIWMPSKKLLTRRIQTQTNTPLVTTLLAKRTADAIGEDCNQTDVMMQEEVTRRNREIMPSNYSTSLNIFVDRVRSFVTCQDGYNKMKENCIWHVGLQLHKTKDNQIWNSTKCRSHFCQFIGMTGSVSCFKCGGKTNHCGGGISCRLKKFEFISHAKASSVCLQCAVFHSVGERHQKNNCPSDRIYGLVIWALRSDSGYRATKHQWRKRCGNQLGIAYPKQVPFRNVTPEMEISWKHALEFVITKESLNYEFWSCVVLALKEEGHLHRLC